MTAVTALFSPSVLLGSASVSHGAGAGSPCVTAEGLPLSGLEAGEQQVISSEALRMCCMFPSLGLAFGKESAGLGPVGVWKDSAEDE